MTETTDSNIKSKIEIIYKDSNGNEHASYEAACIAQVLIEEPKIYLEPYKLKFVAETIAAYQAGQLRKVAVEPAKQVELLHG